MKLFYSYVGTRFSIRWKGHLYLPSKAAGRDTVSALADQLHEQPLAAICHRLKGVFGLLVWDRQKHVWQVAVDNAGLYRMFFDASGRVASSFLDMATNRGARPADISTARLVEFLLNGCVYAPRTLLPGVRRLRGHEVLRLSEDNGAAGLELVEKRFPEPDECRPFAAVLTAHAEDLARSLAPSRVSVDLTGGFDSRLVASLLRAHGVGEEAAMTGEPKSVDTILAARVAGAFGFPFHPQRQDLARLEEDIATAFVDSNGLVDVAKIHRGWQGAHARLGRGMMVMAHGGGGELLKDFYFHHEFPFYGRRGTSLARLYDLRVVPMPLADAQLTPTARQWVRESRTEVVGRLEAFRVSTNHETCDRAFFGFRLPEVFGGHFSTYINLGLNVVAPLMDREVAMAAMAVSPWLRMMEGQHRRLIDGLNREVAALPTTSGYSASCRPDLLARDMVGFATNEMRRLVNKVGQRRLGRPLFPRAGALEKDAEGFVDRLRDLPAFRTGLAALQERGIFVPELDPPAVRAHEVGLVLTLGLCFAHLEQGQHPARRPGIEELPLAATLAS